MNMRIVTSIGFVVHLLFGNLCMMPMAFAEAMPMQNDEAMAMNMTPLVPMSPAHCEHCVHVDQPNDTPVTNGCAGHCLAKANDALTAAISVSSANQIVLALPTAFPAVIESAFVLDKHGASPAPPINLARARSVVMLI